MCSLPVAPEGFGGASVSHSRYGAQCQWVCGKAWWRCGVGFLPLASRGQGRQSRTAGMTCHALLNAAQASGHCHLSLQLWASPLQEKQAGSFETSWQEATSGAWQGLEGVGLGIHSADSTVCGGRVGCKQASTAQWGGSG